MKKTLLVVMLCGAGIFAAYTLGGRLAPAVHAQSQKAPDKCSVPKSYGSAKFVTLNFLGFEDASGTIRWVNIDKGCSLSMVIERQ